MSVARRNASFGAIAAADLGSDERLAELFVEAVARGWWANGHRAVLEFWCLAEKALADDTLGTPGRLFHALVKAGDLSRVTDAQEARAMRRMPANDREALAARAADAAAPAATAPEVDAEALFGPSPVGFHHSVMMMCFLPQKRLPPGERSYATRHGRAALSVEAGSLANPENVGEIRRCAVPFGSRARMVVPYVNACAVRNRGPEVDLGRSLRVFLARLGLSFDGRRGKAVAEQVEAVAAASIVLGQWAGDRAVTSAGRIANQVTFWMARDAAERLVWEPSMRLSDDYYAALAERPVPVDMGPPREARPLAPADGPLHLARVPHRPHPGRARGAYPHRVAARGVRPGHRGPAPVPPAPGGRPSRGRGGVPGLSRTPRGRPARARALAPARGPERNRRAPARAAPPGACEVNRLRCG